MRRALGESLPGSKLSAIGAIAFMQRAIQSRRGGPLMAERRATPRARLTISCLESEWERIREVAESRDESINDHVISAGLGVQLDPAAGGRTGSGAERGGTAPAARPGGPPGREHAVGGLRGVDRTAAAIGRAAAHDDVARPCLAGPVSVISGRCWWRCSAPRTGRSSNSSSGSGWRACRRCSVDRRCARPRTRPRTARRRRPPRLPHLTCRCLRRGSAHDGVASGSAPGPPSAGRVCARAGPRRTRERGSSRAR